MHQAKYEIIFSNVERHKHVRFTLAMLRKLPAVKSYSEQGT